MKRKFTATVAMLLLLGGANSAFAAPNDDYAAELSALKQRMAEIEAKLQATDADTKKAQKVKKTDASDNFKFNGDFRIRSIWNGGPATFEERVRLAATDKVNDTTSFYVRWALMNNNQMGTTSRLNDSLLPTKTNRDDDLSATDSNILSDAYVKINKLFGSDNALTVGRFGQTVGATGYWNSASTYGLLDGAKVDTQSDNLKTTVGFANWSPLASSVSTKVSGSTTTTTVTRTLQNAFFVSAAYSTSPATDLYWSYIKETNSSGSPIDFQVSGPGIKTKINDDWSFRGDYLRNYAAQGNPLGEYFSLMYKGAKDERPHSYGFSLDYHYVQPNNMATTAGSGISLQPSKDIKGPGITAHYSPEKNCMIDFYQSFNTREASTGEKIPNYSRLQLVYGF